MGDAPRGHPSSRRPRSCSLRQLAAPAHPRRDSVAVDDVVAHLVRLPRQQLPSLLDAGTCRCGVTLPAGWIEQVRTLDEAHLRSEKLRELLVRRPAQVERGEKSLDDRNTHCRDRKWPRRPGVTARLRLCRSEPRLTSVAFAIDDSRREHLRPDTARLHAPLWRGGAGALPCVPRARQRTSLRAAVLT